LDGRRVPLDASQRNPGQYPYWGAGSIMDYIDDFIFDEEIVLLGEDGAPFFDKNRPVSFVVNEKVWVNNHIHVIKPNSDVNAKFMMYWFNTVDYGTYINGSILNKLTQSNMDNIAFVNVPYDEQVQIVNHLDQKCAEIDAIIAAKEKTNELLKERRQSIIYEAVTKGLDPTVPMKDSGIEWIGEIPESWSFSKLKYDAYMKGRIG
jgi:type I restriction enzyme S subunit